MINISGAGASGQTEVGSTKGFATRGCGVGPDGSGLGRARRLVRATPQVAPGAMPGAGKPGGAGADREVVRKSNPGAHPGVRARRARPEMVDLRRRDTREWAEVIATRAEHLLPDDRALVRAVFEDGLDAKRVARLQGANSRTVRRRVRALAQRVLSPEFEFVLRRRDGWPRTRRLVATACVLHGRTLREAAAHLRMTLHAVRRQMDLVRALYDEEHAR